MSHLKKALRLIEGDAHAFCRSYLKELLQDAGEHISKEDQKAAWTHKTGNQWEFHGPNDFYWHGQSCCSWYAKAEGWTSYLRSIEAPGYGLGDVEDDEDY